MNRKMAKHLCWHINGLIHISMFIYPDWLFGEFGDRLRLWKYYRFYTQHPTRFIQPPYLVPQVIFDFSLFFDSIFSFSAFGSRASIPLLLPLLVPIALDLLDEEILSPFRV